jgi:hypothetical protein
MSLIFSQEAEGGSLREETAVEEEVALEEVSPQLGIHMIFDFKLQFWFYSGQFESCQSQSQLQSQRKSKS